MESAGASVVFVLFFLGFGLFWLATTVYWIYTVVEVVRIPDEQFRAARTDKTAWLLVVILGHLIGALVWLIAKRRDVLAAAGRIPAPAPGWYPEPSGGALRWWDGTRWTEARHEAPSA